MGQRNKIITESDKARLTRIVTGNFIAGAKEIIESNNFEHIRSEDELAAFLQTNRSYISMLRNQENRQVTTDMLLKAVATLGLDANYFFALDEKQRRKEKLFRDETTVKQEGPGAKNSVSHRNNAPVLQIGDNAVISGDIHQKVEKIMQGLSPKERSLMKAQYEEFRKGRVEVSAMSEEMKELKKTLALCEKSMKDKDKTIKAKQATINKQAQEFDALNRKYIDLLEKMSRKK